MGAGAKAAYQPQPNSEYLTNLGRQSLSDNVQRREGKNPEPQLRPRSGR
ncbi:MAG: hypothetical protein NVSMB54_37930 [Ktedonobacteraceae bacterium]